MAGLALTGAAVPAAFYGHRQWTKPDPTITPGEASFDVADVAGQRLADSLRGVWQIRFEGLDAGLEGGTGRLQARWHGAQSAQNGRPPSQLKRTSLRKSRSGARRGLLRS